jgi:hypothetical protein
MQYFLIGMYNSSNRRAGYNAANFVMKKKKKKQWYPLIEPLSKPVVNEVVARSYAEMTACFLTSLD